MKTVWRFYLNSKHLSMKRETLSPPCTVLCQYLLGSRLASHFQINGPLWNVITND